MKKLSVSGKSLMTDDNKPFFFTACTAWELFHKLTLEEAKLYINNRVSKGFNVIQAVAVAELDGLNTPAYEGQLLPFADLKTLEINDAYFDHVTDVIKYANEQGLYVALVPMWGSHFIPNEQWGGETKPVFDENNVVPFIRDLSQRVKDLGVIWMLGGDRSYLTKSHRAVVENMAINIRAICGTSQLITAHTQGGRSIYDMFEQPDWLDFITWQTGHMGENYPSWYPIEHDYLRHNLPVLDAEPCYESHPLMNEYTFSRADCASRFTDRHIRRTSYWSVFAGGAGITYGCYSLWQMRREEDDNIEVPESAAVAYRGDTIPYWHQSLDYPGAFQIGILNRFMMSLEEIDKRKPANELLLSDNPIGSDHVQLMCHSRAKWLAAYIPSNQQVVIDVSMFGLDGFEIYWFNPIYGVMNKASDDISESLLLSISTPLVEQDWVLLLKAKNSD